MATEVTQPRAQLYYYHRTEFLKGGVAGKRVSVHAASGGNRAATTFSNRRFDEASYDARLAKGPLPKGDYTLWYLGKPYGIYLKGAVYISPSRIVCAAIKADRTCTDFLIHHPGSRGSEGCIVPYSEDDADALLGLFELYGRTDWEKPHGRLRVVDDPLSIQQCTEKSRSL